jgi:hypothetical protein
MTSSVASREGSAGNLACKLGTVMNADRILGALIWCIWNDQLPDELLELVQSASEEFPKYLVGDNGPETDLIARAQGFLRSSDPSLRDLVIAGMKEELVRIIEDGH